MMTAIIRRDILSDILYGVRDLADLVALTGLPDNRCGEILDMRDPLSFFQDDLDEALLDVVSAASDRDLARIAKLEVDRIQEARAAVAMLQHGNGMPFARVQG